MKECSVCRYCFPDDFNNCPTDGQRLKLSIEGDTVLDGRYQLDKRLGHGGMGIVFQARHIFLKTSYAIKVILPDLVGNDPMLVTRFRQEAMVAARLHHPNLVNVTDFGVVNSMPYLVMELINGSSLHELLARDGRMSPRQTLEIISEVCSGVGAAHAQGVVHRDLKPLNIMLTSGAHTGRGVKVLDFGLAKIKSGELLGSFIAAQTTGLMGSPSYMAPELWSDDEPDARTDIYSLGVIVFQMLSGEIPFRGGTIPAIMHKHLTEPPPSFAERGIKVPWDIEEVVHRALAKNREARQPSVEVFVDELREAVLAMDSAFDLTQKDLATQDARTVPLPEVSVEQRTLTEKQKRIEDEVDEVERLAHEFEEAQRRADEARQRAEEAARRKAEEEEARKRAEEEAARKLAEEEEARRRAEEVAHRQAAEEAARRKAEAEIERKRLEAEARKQEEEEQARKSAAQEAIRLAREIAEVQQRAEQARLRADEEARKRTEEEAARKRAEEDARKLALEVAEAKRRAEEAQERAEEDDRHRATAEAARREAEEEQARKRAAEDARKRKADDEAQKLAAIEADRLSREVSAAQRRADEAGKRAEEEAQKRAVEEAARRKAEEEARRLALEVEEAKRRVEEARKRIEEAQRESAAEKELRRQDHESAATLIRSKSPEEAARPDASSARMDATIQAHVRPDVPLPTEGEHDQLKTLQVAPLVQQSHPSLEGSLQTQPTLYSSIPNIAAPKGSRNMAMIIGGLAMLIIVGIGLTIGAYWLWSGKQPGAQPGVVGTPPSDSKSPMPSSTPSLADMVRIEGGAFRMGLDDVGLPTRQTAINEYNFNQYPAHRVTVGSFFMDRTEVTNAEYADFIAETEHTPPAYWQEGKFPPGQERLPVTNVSVIDAYAFAEWRTKRDGVKHRLPTEEEWEYAARNGSQENRYPWGNEWHDYCANVNKNPLVPVGSYPRCSSQAGALDLIGNVWEWTSSEFVLYPGNAKWDSLGLKKPEGQVIRGGAYDEPSDGPSGITATRRSVVPPTDKQPTIGFRLVRSGP